MNVSLPVFLHTTLLASAMGCGALATEPQPAAALIAEARIHAGGIADRTDRWRVDVAIAGAEMLHADRAAGRQRLLDLGWSAEYGFELGPVLDDLIRAGDIAAVAGLLPRAGTQTLSLAIDRAVSAGTDGNLLALARLQRDPHRRAHDLARAGAAAAAGGQLAAAQAAAGEIADLGLDMSTAGVDLLCAIAEAHGHTAPEAADAVLARAAGAARGLRRSTLTDRPRDRAWSRIAQTRAALGQDRKTDAAIRQIEKVELADWARLDAALAAARTGHRDLAHTLLHGLENDVGAARGQSRNRLVSIRLALGDLQAARDLLPGLAENCDSLVEALAEIAATQAETGDFRGAASTVGIMPVRGEPSLVLAKATAFEALANAQARAGLFAAAQEIVAAIPTGAIGDEPGAVDCGLQRGHVAVPHDEAEAFPSAANRDIALWATARAARNLARARVAAGQLATIWAWARLEDRPLVRVFILLGAVDGLADP